MSRRKRQLSPKAIRKSIEAMPKVKTHEQYMAMRVAYYVASQLEGLGAK